jgi:hypothetical protein
MHHVALGHSRAPHGAWATPMQGANPSATWSLGLGKGPDWLCQPRRNVALAPSAQQHFCLYKNICYKYYFFSYNSKYSYQKYYYLCYKYYYFYYNSKYWYKNIIIYVIIILEILNIIIYVINIIIFIIINVIYKFEKTIIINIINFMFYIINYKFL